MEKYRTYAVLSSDSIARWKRFSGERREETRSERGKEGDFPHFCVQKRLVGQLSDTDQQGSGDSRVPETRQRAVPSDVKQDSEEADPQMPFFT
jgi:hypothetical protein